jgi:hypothetical protein
MNEQQRVRQMQAIHMEYARKVREGIYPPLHPEAGEGCHLWATQTLGRLIPTLKICTDYELNVLRDRLNGKDGKLLLRVRAEFERLDIGRPDQWIARCADSDSFRAWRGQTLETLPVSQLYRLLKMLERRSPGKRVTSHYAGNYSSGHYERREVPLFPEARA